MGVSRASRRLAIAWILLVFAGEAVSAEQAGEMTLDVEAAAEHFVSRGYSPYADRAFPTRPFWGDADRRSLDANGELPAVGNTVDVANATWTNTIGDPELITVWTDPEFDPEQRAFYYVRVLEIPTPRWVAYDAYRYGLDIPDNVPLVLQERAYTSPIWFTPR